MHNYFHIEGMHCVSCEILITDVIENMWGKVFFISSKSGKLHTTLKSKKDIQTLKDFCSKNNFSLIPISEDEYKQISEKKNTLKNIFIIWGIFGIYFLGWKFLWESFISFQKNISGNSTYIIALILGITASISTCLALLGAIVMNLGRKNMSPCNISSKSYYSIFYPRRNSCYHRKEYSNSSACNWNFKYRNWNNCYLHRWKYNGNTS